MSLRIQATPAEFVDEEIIKTKLEAMQEQLDRIEGKLEALQASLDKVSAISGATRIHR